jgi:crotonobetainyl-CoA:carnitine CoA-transferase CaiB-like acyl-CoA transferase
MLVVLFESTSMMFSASAASSEPFSASSSSPTPAHLAGALAGVRVLDLTSVLMGPLATVMLGDYGADVIKVEAKTGDTVRGIGPMKNPGMGQIFLHMNRNKRSIVLDLKTPEGKAALLRLAAKSDVLIYNIRPQAMQRLGLGFDALQVVNPRLIYCGLFGYGQNGPYADYPAYDDLIQGISAIPSLVAQVGDGTPRYVPLAFIDRTVGHVAVGAICAALYARERTGRGQSIDLPMFETMVPFVLGDHMSGATFDPPLGEMGYPRQLAPQRRPFQTRDGYVCVLLYNDKHWKSFFEGLGQAERFTQDPRLASITERTLNIDALYGEVGQLLSQKSTEHWLDFFQKADIPAVPLNTLESLLKDPHLEAVGAFAWREHPSEGPLRSLEPIGRWSDTPPSVRFPAPQLGQHTVEILREADFNEAEIQAIIEASA